jgi:hypothetical protein
MLPSKPARPPPSLESPVEKPQKPGKPIGKPTKKPSMAPSTTPGALSTTPSPSSTEMMSTEGTVTSPPPPPPSIETEVVSSPAGDGFKVVCYFTNWAWYRYVYISLLLNSLNSLGKLKQLVLI